MKNLLCLTVLCLILTSCASVKRTNKRQYGCPTFSNNECREYRIVYGDERFDNMEDCKTEVYTICGNDTTFLRNEYRVPFYLQNKENAKKGTPLQRLGSK